VLYGGGRGGAGAAGLPEFSVAEGWANGAVVELMPDWTCAPLWLTLYSPPYEQLPPLVATFSTFFEDWVTQDAVR